MKRIHFSNNRPYRVLFVDLNNFSLHPTMAVGYIASSLRDSGMSVTVLSPLAYGIDGIFREPEETALVDWSRRINYALTQLPFVMIEVVRRWFRTKFIKWSERKQQEIIDVFEQVNLDDFDVVLVSSYLMYFNTSEKIGKICKTHKVPLIIGGSYMTQPSIIDSWRKIPGLTALIVGEVELEIAGLVSAVVEKEDISSYPGVYLPDGSGAGIRAPLTRLDEVPFPDYSDFPWQKYPRKIIPIMTGRGCGWGACNFCSDVTSTSGRTFRSRSPENVLSELQYQSERFDTSLFAFADIKLNSNLDVWYKIVNEIEAVVPNPQWVGSVHVGLEEDNGLSYDTLVRARKAGCLRLTTGLESGSQRVLDNFSKGTNIEVTSRFLRDAANAGISMRVTMIHGAPGETAEDVEASAQFLSDHMDVIERVSLSRFLIMIGTTFQRRYEEKPSRYPDIIASAPDDQEKKIYHRKLNTTSWSYFRATQRLLGVVSAINKKQLTRPADIFEGVL